jgi:methylmalonyl-CoA/ethylmalonyl-CoA epimerase
MLQLHHIGIVVTDLSASGGLYHDRFGYEARTPVIHDSIQGANVQFWRLPGDSVYVEFVSPDGPDSKLNSSARKGDHLHHLCYATPDIDSACVDLAKKKMTLIRAPVSAVAFGGRRIAWLMGRDQGLIELVERGHEGDL